MARLEPVAFADLPGWRDDRHEEALAAFRRGCARMAGAAWRAACAGAAAHEGDARGFFESRFVPHRVVADGDGRGFLTGYYEPELAGARAPGAGFAAPLYARPDDLVALDGTSPRAGLDPALTAARATAEGLAPYPTRAEIEAGALAGRGLELVYLADRIEAFFVHVQGSVRVRLAGGGVVRLGYAGRNGHPYVSIGRRLIEDGIIAREEMTATRLRAWLKDNPDRADAVMRENPSFIFFRELDGLDPALGPPGAQGVPLTPLRSLAVDPAFHAYGTPVWLAAELPGADGRPAAFRRLMIAQDTGSAIRGPARGDIFFGSGDAAGERAGRIRHAGDVFVLLPAGAAEAE